MQKYAKYSHKNLVYILENINPDRRCGPAEVVCDKQTRTIFCKDTANVAALAGLLQKFVWPLVEKQVSLT